MLTSGDRRRCSGSSTRASSTATSAGRRCRCRPAIRFAWEADSTYIRKPPFLEGLTMTPAPPTDIAGARVLAVLGDSITTDHISPAGIDQGRQPGGQVPDRARRRAEGLQLVRRAARQPRGDDARHVRQHAPQEPAGARHRRRRARRYLPGGEVMTIYDAAMKYQAAGVPLMVIAGKEYGSGSSRDWAAKGTMLLGVKAVIAESFERIHRSNLVNMGVLPLQFKAGENAASLGLTGREVFSLAGAGAALKPRGEVTVPRDGARTASTKTFTATARIDTPEELVAFSHGGILPYVLRQLVKKSSDERHVDTEPGKRSVFRLSGRSACSAPLTIKEQSPGARVRSVRHRAGARLSRTEFLSEWLARGYAGEMDYMEKSAHVRADIRHFLPSARSVIVTGTVYNTDSGARVHQVHRERGRCDQGRALCARAGLSQGHRGPADRARRVDAGE